MKRLLPLFVLILLFTPAIAKKKSSLRAELLSAKFVVVTTYPDGGQNLRTDGTGFADDRRALADVEQAIRKWGRWTVLSTNNQADLIVAIRKGRAAGAGVKIPVPDINIGGPAPRTPEGRSPTNPRPTLSAESGPDEDMIAIYSAHNADPTESPNIDGPPMWRLIQANALGSPTVPGIQQLRRDIEKAEAENGKK